MDNVEDCHREHDVQHHNEPLHDYACDGHRNAGSPRRILKFALDLAVEFALGHSVDITVNIAVDLSINFTVDLAVKHPIDLAVDIAIDFTVVFTFGYLNVSQTATTNAVLPTASAV